MQYSPERRETRFPVAGIEGTLKSPSDVRVLNLSRNGIAFETGHKLTVGEDYFLEVRYKGQIVSFGVNLRWCSRKRNSRDSQPIYIAGGEFTDIVSDGPGGLWSGLLPSGFGEGVMRPR